MVPGSFKQAVALAALFSGLIAVGMLFARAHWKKYLSVPLLGIAVLLAVMLITGLIGLGLDSLHVRQYPALMWLLTLAVGTYLSLFVSAAWGTWGQSSVRHVRGARVLGESHPLASKKRKSPADSIRFAGFAIPREDEVKHFKLIGATGTGKSTVMRQLIDGALKRGDRAVIADPDGGYLSRFYNPARGDLILNPFDARSARWDVMAEIHNPYDVAQLARSLIPERGGDPQWPGFSRTFFESVVEQAREAGIKDLNELYRLLVSAPQDELRILLANTPAAPFTEEATLKLFMGLRSTAAEHLKCLDYIRRQKGDSLSVKQWVKNGRGVLFLPYLADQIAALRGVISTWLRLAIFQTMSLGEGDHRLWFAVDELDALGAIDGLPDALVRLRRFGGRCVLGFQSIGQVSATFGNGPAEAMVENCANTLILRCSASERGGTSKFASQLIGDRHLIRPVYTENSSRGSIFGRNQDHKSEGTTHHHVVEPAMMAAEIEQFPDRSGVLKIASQPAWMRLEFPIYDLPKVAEPFVSA